MGDAVQGGTTQGVPAGPLAVLVGGAVDPHVDPDEECHGHGEGQHHVDEDVVGAVVPWLTPAKT